MAKSSPCFGCENRVLGCHSGCEPYQEYSAERKKISELRMKYNETETRFIESKRNLKKGR